MKYRYYSRFRPVGPGTFPNHDVLEIHNYDSRTYIDWTVKSCKQHNSHRKNKEQILFAKSAH